MCRIVLEYINISLIITLAFWHSGKDFRVEMVVWLELGLARVRNRDREKERKV